MLHPFYERNSSITERKILTVHVLFIGIVLYVENEVKIFKRASKFNYRSSIIFIYHTVLLQIAN